MTHVSEVSEYHYPHQFKYQDAINQLATQLAMLHTCGVTRLDLDLLSDVMVNKEDKQLKCLVDTHGIGNQQFWRDLWIKLLNRTEIIEDTIRRGSPPYDYEFRDTPTAKPFAGGHLTMTLAADSADVNVEYERHMRDNLGANTWKVERIGSVVNMVKVEYKPPKSGYGYYYHETDSAQRWTNVPEGGHVLTLARPGLLQVSNKWCCWYSGTQEPMDVAMIPPDLDRMRSLWEVAIVPVPEPSDTINNANLEFLTRMTTLCFKSARRAHTTESADVWDMLLRNWSKMLTEYATHFGMKESEVIPADWSEQLLARKIARKLTATPGI
jgi:hypothetical protein